MKNAVHKVLIFLVPLLLLSSIAFASEPSGKTPFPDRETFINALFEAGLSQVFEFKASASSFSIIRQALNSHQEKSIKKQSMDQYIEDTTDWERVPALDYVIKSAMFGAMNIGRTKLGTKRYEAYKVGGFAICHKLEDGYLFSSIDGSRFHSCVAVPMDVNEIIERLELRGFLD